jgi:cold shock CspA family protein
MPVLSVSPRKHAASRVVGSHRSVVPYGREVYFHHHAVGGRAFTELRAGDTVQIELQQSGEDQHAHAVKLVRLARSR